MGAILPLAGLDLFELVALVSTCSADMGVPCQRGILFDPMLQAPRCFRRSSKITPVSSVGHLKSPADAWFTAGFKHSLADENGFNEMLGLWDQSCQCSTAMPSAAATWLERKRTWSPMVVIPISPSGLCTHPHVKTLNMGFLHCASLCWASHKMKPAEHW